MIPENRDLFQPDSCPHSEATAASMGSITSSAEVCNSKQLSGEKKYTRTDSRPRSGNRHQVQEVVGWARKSLSEVGTKKCDASRRFGIPIPERLLRRPEVEYLCGLSRSSLYRLIAANQFPPGIKLSKNAVAWRSSSIQEWIAERIAAADLAQTAKVEER